MDDKKEVKCTKAAKQARNEYLKQWRAAHPDAVKRHNNTYWNNRAARMAAQAAAAQSDSEGPANGSK